MTSKSIEPPAVPARQLVSWTCGVAAVAAAFWLLIRFHHLLLLLLTAIFLSTALRPGVARLEQRGVPRLVGLLALFVAIGAALGALIWFSVPVLAEQGAALRATLADSYGLLREVLGELPNILVRRLLLLLPSELPSGMAAPTALPGDEAAIALDATLARVGELARLALYLVAVALMTFYWSYEGERIKQASFLLVPLPRRAEVRTLVGEIEMRIGRYLLGQAVLCLVIAGLAFVAYAVIGLPHALLLAVLAGLLEAIPILGPFLGAVPAVIVGLSLSPTTALWVLLASVLIQQLENSVLVPRIMNQTIGINPLVTMLALLAFGSLFGVLGALIALPLAAVLQLLLERYLLARESLEQTEPGRDRLSVTRYATNQLVQDVRNQIRRKDDAPSAVADALEDEVEAIALDLETFLALQNGGQG